MTGDNCSAVVSSAGSMGVLGLPSDTNAPAARYSSSQWTGSDSNLYLSGGYVSGLTGGVEDMWRWTRSTRQWVWLWGSGNASVNPTHTNHRLFAASTTPGSRSSSCSAVGSDGNLYMFGGYGGAVWRDDLHAYSIRLNQWSWLSGQAANQPPSWSTQGIPVSGLTAVVGSRELPTCWWSGGNFYVFGGRGYPGPLAHLNGLSLWLTGRLDLCLSLSGCMYAHFYRLSLCTLDLWSYDVINDQWTWLIGSNAFTDLTVSNSAI
jgi:hypothetical protein